MTILCITTERLPGIRPCRHVGQHRVRCHDHEGWSKRPGICLGCLPRKADRGYLCHSCYDRVDAAHLKWAGFARLVIETDGRVVSPEGKGAAPEGYTNLPLTFLALDECTRLLRSLSGRTLDAWVHTEDGARDAIMFAHAAERAYQALEVEKRELKLERVRCPKCDQLTLTGNTTRKHHGSTIVECQNCGEQLDKIRDDHRRWVGSEVCEGPAGAAHLDCTSLHCGCLCHGYGRESQTMGVSALWDADLHAARPNLAPRELWAVLSARDIHLLAVDERKTA